MAPRYRSTLATLVVMGAVACGGSPPVVKKSEEVVDAPPPPPDPGLPKASGKQGIVFSADGAPLELRVLATGASVQVADGTPLELVSEQSGHGLGRADAEVMLDGQKGILPNAAVLVGERVTVSPDGALAVFVATRECEPECLSEAWLIHRDGRRLRIGDIRGAPIVAFSANGYQVALGHRGLWLVHVGTWKVFKYKEFTAPAFAPDNILFVRAHGQVDSVHQVYQGGQAGEVVSEPGDPATPDPSPVAFEEGGKVIVTVFARKGGDKTVKTKR